MPLINVNVGVLGHVDCGKTSICKLLSEVASTAAFDSNPQSKERGITLDLGFSSFQLENKWNITMIDCPGHSSLIRTVIGGSQIMDLMILVVDISKGIQPQTAECLILASITCKHLIVLLNKVDLLSKDKKESQVTKVNKLMTRAITRTNFVDVPILPFSTRDDCSYKEDFLKALSSKISSIELKRDTDSPFLMAIDHCFSVKGHGTVVTGTILQGKLKVNDTIEFSSLQLSKKIKSIQMFRKPVSEAMAGDRIGASVQGLAHDDIERSLISAAGVVKTKIRAGVFKISRIPFFKESISTKRKYHVAIGYENTTCSITLFKHSGQLKAFNPDLEYLLMDEFSETNDVEETIFAVFVLDRPISAVPGSLVIGFDLQFSEAKDTSRLCFHSRLDYFTTEKQYSEVFLPQIKIYRRKQKLGTLDKIHSSHFIAKGFCRKSSNIDYLIGRTVDFVTGEGEERKILASGIIESRFGQTDKVRVNLKTELSAENSADLRSNMKSIRVVLDYKKFLFTRTEKKQIKQ